MNYYPYHKEIENNGNINDFFDKKNFVGYILPDGTIYPCEEHNIGSIASLFNLILDCLCKYYDAKDKYLEEDCDDKLIQLIMNYFEKIPYEQAVDLNNFIVNNNIDLSDILVSLFGCHLVTRLNKKILTSSISHQIFYNYLLMGYEIETVPKIIYQNGKHSFYSNDFYNNDFLYDEIKTINNEAFVYEKSLFFR